MKLEVVVVPVADADRSKRFYGGLGWRLDADFAGTDGMRVIQLTPPGSLQGLHLVVTDIEKARAELAERGADVGEPFHDATGIFHHAGREARVHGPAAEHADYGSFAAFSDPDGNGWVLQEIKVRAPGR